MQHPILNHKLFSPDIIKQAREMLQAETVKETQFNSNTEKFVQDLIDNNIIFYKRLRNR